MSAEIAERLEERIRQERLDRARTARNPRDQKGGKGERSGSGVLVTNQGHVVTARHVVDGCDAVSVHHPSGRQNTARVLALHEKADLALLSSELHQQPKVVLAPSKPLTRGAALAVVGYPNMGRTAIRPLRSEARFAAKRVVGDKNLKPAIRIIFEGELRAGNSGGALVDGQGRLVGIVVAQLDTPAVFKKTGKLVQHIGIAEPLAAMRELFEDADVAIRSSSSALESNRVEGAVYRITCYPKK